LKYLYLFILMFSLLNCRSSKGVLNEDEKVAKPTFFFWVSFEPNKSNVLEKSTKEVIANYYSLLYKPSRNRIDLVNLAGNPVMNLVIEKKEEDILPAIEVISEEIDYYKVFIPEERKSDLLAYIKKYKTKVQTLKLEFKVTENPETLIFDEIISNIKNHFKTKILEKKALEDFKISANFLVTRLYNFEYRSNMVSFSVDFVFTDVKQGKLDYAAYSNDVIDIIEKAIADKNYTEATKYNEIYKDILSNKIPYYKYNYKMHEEQNDLISCLIDLTLIFNEAEDDTVEKDTLSKFRDIFQSKIKNKKDIQKINKTLDTEYKNYMSDKKTKEEFLEVLKSIIIEYPIE